MHPASYALLSWELKSRINIFHSAYLGSNHHVVPLLLEDSCAIVEVQIRPDPIGPTLVTFDHVACSPGIKCLDRITSEASCRLVDGMMFLRALSS